MRETFHAPAELGAITWRARHETRSPGPAAATSKALRVQIDKLDLQILELVNERAAVAAADRQGEDRAGRRGLLARPAKKKSSSNVLEANKGPLDEVTLRAIFRELISGSRALQKVQKVAFLGPEYSYSHLAALERFGEAVEYMRVGSIAAVFEEVDRKHVDLGVVPLENSTDGRIADTLDMFIRMPQLKICAEIRLRVHHNLLANCEQTEIRRVYSKAAGAVAVPQLAEQERAARVAARGGEHGGRGPAGADRAGRGRGRQPAGGGPLRPRASSSRTSRTRRTTRRASRSSARPTAAKTGNDKTALMFQVAAHARRRWPTCWTSSSRTRST